MNNDMFKFRTPWYLGNKFAGFQYWEFEHGRVKLIGEHWESWVSKRDELTAKPDEQCTGLKDKNGDLIWNGDVIQFTHNRGYFTNKGDIRVIEFGAFRFCGFGWRYRPENNVEFALTESAAKKCVVIGNIHEKE